MKPLRRMSPASMTLAYQIHGNCSAHGWERTAAEIADALGVTPARLRQVAAMMPNPGGGTWLARFRTNRAPEFVPGAKARHWSVDRALTEMGL